MSDEDKVLQLDEDAVIKQLMPKLGAELSPVIAEQIKAAIDGLGLDRVDRKHGMFPGIDEGENAKLTMKQRTEKFLRAAIFGSKDPVMMKALSEGTDSAGGYLVPEDYRKEFVMWAAPLSECFQYATVIPVNTDAGYLPKAAAGITMTWDDGENGSFTESDATFGQLSYTIHRMNALSYLSREVANDSNPSIVPVITKLFAEAVAEERDKMIAIGSDSSQPKGIYSETGVDSVTVSGSITYNKLVETKFTLKRRYHKNARWLMNSTNFQRITALEDDNGMPIIPSAILAAAIPVVLGKPVSIEENMPDSAICFGDFSKYIWFDRESMGIESTTVGGDTFAKHQVGIKVWERCDGQLALNGSGKLGAFVRATNITA